jgi:hypothetical protein
MTMDDETPHAEIESQAAAGAPASPVPTTVVAGRGTRRRWAIALVVAAVAIGAALAAASFLGRPQAPEALRYVPADSVVVAEMRLDLPGDQRARLGSLLAHFPGFKDQSILDDKIDEALGRIVRSSTDGAVDYEAELKPFVRAPVFLFTTSVQATEAGSFAVVATVDGKATCATAFRDRPTTDQTYRDVRIEVQEAGRLACAIDGRHALIGDVDLVKAAIDTRRDGRAIDGSARYRDARAAIPGDRLATLFYSGEGLRSLASAAPSLAPMIDALPDWAVIGVRAEDASLVADVVYAPPKASSVATGATSSPTHAPARRSAIAVHLPPDTIFEADAHEAGRAIVDGLAALRSDPAFAADLEQIDQAVSFLGGIGSLVGWIDDAGVAIVPDGSSVAGGLVLRADDAKAAQDRVAQLRAVLALAGGSLDVRQETIDGVQVTIVDLGPVSTLLGDAGIPGGGQSPVPSDARLELAFAVRDDIVIVGQGDAFVRAVLGVQAGRSLAESDPYAKAIGSAGGVNVGQAYLDVRAVIRIAESQMSGQELARWKADTKPYLGPFRSVVATTDAAGGGAHLRIVATVE